MPKYIHSGNFARRVCNFQGIDEHSANAVIHLLYTEPAADVVEVKHGYDTGNANIFECSVCGYGVDDIYEADEKNYPVWKFNYCPHCGAKMDGGKAE